MNDKGSNEISLTKPFSENITPSVITKYIIQNSMRLHPAQIALIKETLKHPKYYMMGDICQLKFFECLLRNMQAKMVIDVGVFTGCSALSAALALPHEGKVFALDIEEEFVNIGKPYFKQAGVEHKIDIRIAPAIETLDRLIEQGYSEKIDFIFIDAVKVEYNDYYERGLKLLRKGGIIALDNLLFRGDILNPEGDERLLHLKEMTIKLKSDNRVMFSLLPIGDGAGFAFKL